MPPGALGKCCGARCDGRGRGSAGAPTAIVTVCGVARSLIMKQRYVRPGDDLQGNITVVVRGGTLDAGLLRQDAQRNHAVYNTYGISVFAARDLTVDELAQQPPLIRFGMLTVMSAGAIRRAGLRLEATGRNPRHFDICFDDLDDGIARLINCEHHTMVNPYHEA